jgi:hypothetical protein
MTASYTIGSKEEEEEEEEVVISGCLSEISVLFDKKRRSGYLWLSL